LELMAEELAALKRQIAELRRPEQSERRPEQPERAEQKPEQGSRATSLAAQARTGARNVSALGPAGAGHVGVASADAPAPSLTGLGGATAPPAGFARRPTLPTLKLGTYDGRTSLETFLAKFNIVVSIMRGTRVSSCAICGQAWRRRQARYYGMPVTSPQWTMSSSC